MADVRAIALVALYCIWWPISKLVQALLVILSPIWIIAQFVFLPFAYLVHAIISVVLFPFRLHLLERIETIYIYLGIAGLIGCITGVILFLLFRFLASALQIDTIVDSDPREKGRTTTDYRVARRERKQEEADKCSTPTVVKPVVEPRKRGLLSQTIIEEEDSDF